MLTDEFFKKWYAAFAPNVDPIIMREHIKADGCCPWHIFTIGKVDCLSGNEAFSAYKKIAPNDVYCYVGHDYENEWCEIRKNDFIEITALRQTGDEIYITALDFSWTFVWTHEDLFGPYFLEK